MITKEKILYDLNKTNKSNEVFNLLVDELVFYFQKFSNDIQFSEFVSSKNNLNLLLIKNEVYNLHIELTNDFIQIQLYDNSEILIYFDNSSVINDVKKVISSVLKGEFEIENHLDLSNKIISKKLFWNDVNLSKYNQEYSFNFFKKEFLRAEKHKGIRLL